MDDPAVHLPPFLCTLDLLWLSPSVRTSMRVGRVPMTNDGKHASVQKARYVIRQTYMRLLGDER